MSSYTHDFQVGSYHTFWLQYHSAANGSHNIQQSTRMVLMPWIVHDWGVKPHQIWPEIICKLIERTKQTGTRHSLLWMIEYHQLISDVDINNKSIVCEQWTDHHHDDDNERADCETTSYEVVSATSMAYLQRGRMHNQFCRMPRLTGVIEYSRTAK